MKLAFDVMGSDYGSKAPIIAVLEIIKKHQEIEEIILVGKKEEIENHLRDILKKKPTPKQISIHHAPDVISMKAGAIEGVRMPNSSMSQAVKLVQEGKVDGVLTSGSTAAYLGICHLILKEIPGIRRPAFMPVMPTAIAGKKVLLLDVGANIENTSEELITFAVMAHIYSQLILNVASPTIGLLNIGTEENKGPEVLKETYAKLKKLTQKDEKLNFLNFHGNFESRYLLTGNVDIVICDGYSGNLVLKAWEGAGSLLFGLLRKEYTKNIWRKIVALLSKPVFKGVKTTFDYKNHAGAQLLGINGICFKTHGSSDVQSYFSTLELLITAVKQDVTNKIKSQISLLK